MLHRTQGAIVRISEGHIVIIAPGEWPQLPSFDVALVDFAQQGNREDFDWLARASGIAQDKLDEVWGGCRTRLGLDES